VIVGRLWLNKSQRHALIAGGFALLAWIADNSGEVIGQVKALGLPPSATKDILFCVSSICAIKMLGGDSIKVEKGGN
jgi:hypothetical protein